MIDGLKLDVTADAKTLDSTARADEEDDEYTDEVSVGARLRRRAQRERERAEALSFMRNHVVRGETYRLTNEDLRTLEILPTRSW